MAKILLITTIYPPEIGGPATFINHFARFLTDKGNKVTVVCLSYKKHLEIDKKELFSVYRITPGFLKVTFHIRKWLILFYTILNNDKVLLNGLEEDSYRICKLLKRKYILKIVGDKAWEVGRNNSLTTLNIDEFQKEPIENLSLLQIRKMMQNYVKAAYLVYVPSDYLKGIVMGWGKKEEDVVVIHNSVPLQTIKKIEKKSIVLFRILFVGRITNWKGVELLLLAVNGMKNVEVTICGDGPALSVYEEMNRRLGNLNVIFTGRIKPSVVSELLIQTDILVLASLYEGLSHTLLEAISFGKPCIASNIGGNPEVITHGYNGLLFEPYNHNELKEHILKLVNDNDYYNKLADGALESTLKFNIDNNFKRVEDLLLQL
jgi:glycosyltransferase involved in cell wall biosynthesis